MTLNEKLAEYLKAHAGEWINGYDLMRVGGSFAFRTRLSELRMAPWHMAIDNRVERHKRTESDGTIKHWTTTEYRYVAPATPKQPNLFAGDHASSN